MLSEPVAVAPLSRSRDLTPQKLRELLASEKPPILVDVREPEEQKIVQLPNSLSVPLGELFDRWSELEELARASLRDLVLYCRSGCRTEYALTQIGLDFSKLEGSNLEPGNRGNSNPKVTHLAGGILARAKEIDPSMVTY